MKTLTKFSSLKAGVAPVVLGLAMLSSPSFAQNAAEEDTTQEEIVVTGSLIANPNLERSAPVNVTSAAEIERTGSNVAEQILREIPGIVPSIGSAVNNGNGGASFVNLRGLGSFRNIVLVDGVRMTPGELNGRFDLNNIPVALLERVEVLTGGASTTYGADAVSGVVNFVTKRDFSGIEAQISNTITEKGDGNYLRADVTIGANFDDDRGNVVFSVGYQESDPIYQGARRISENNIDSFTGTSGGSGTTVPSRFLIPGVGLRQIDPAAGAFRPTAAFAAFNFNPYNIFQTPFDRFNMYGSARYEISDSVEVYTRGLFSKNSVDTIIAPSGAFGIQVQVPLSNPFLPAGARTQFCNALGLSAAQCTAAGAATDPASPDYREVTSVLARRAVENGPRISDFNTTVFDYRLGLRGGITDGIDWDVFGSYGESENIQSQNGYWLNSRVRQALRATNPNACIDTSNNCVPVNLFGPAGSITPAMNAFLSAQSNIAIKFTQAQARATVSGDTGFTVPWASDSVSFAVGGEFREYRGTSRSDLLSQGGDLGGAGGAAPDITGGYSVYEAIGELNIPLVQDKPFFKNLTVEAGIRYSSYSVAAPTNPSYKTTTWKAGGSWEPVDGVKIRGGYARSVRAPNIAELFAPQNTGLTNLADDPCANLDDNGNPIPGRAAPTGVLRDVCLAQGAPASQIGQIAVPTAGQANATAGGNLLLRPEKSNSWTLGVVLQPEAIPGFSLSLDYYNIKISKAITTPTPGDAIAACFGAGNLSATNPACLSIRRDPLTGNLAGDPAVVKGLFLALSNLGSLETDGIDLVMDYSRDLGFADLKLALNGNYTFNAKFNANALAPGSLNRECVGFYSANCGSIQPKFQWSQRTTLDFEDVELSLLWRHIDNAVQEPQDVIDSGPAFKGTLPANLPYFGGQTVDFGKIKSYDYFDLSAQFSIGDNVTITALASNIFNRKPPLVGSTIGTTAFNSGNTYPSTYDALGRSYTLTARLKF